MSNKKKKPHWITFSFKPYVHKLKIKMEKQIEIS